MVVKTIVVPVINLQLHVQGTIGEQKALQIYAQRSNLKMPLESKPNLYKCRTIYNTLTRPDHTL